MTNYGGKRATPVTQRDGSVHQNNNCRMASAATGIDYDTQGRTTSTGKEMRRRSGDTVGGTSSAAAVKAWGSYGQMLVVRNGEDWDSVNTYLKKGRVIHLDVWHASVGGPCLSGSGGYGHTVVIAPEQSGTRWLVSDPWCKPAAWKWWEASKLRAGAEEWGRRVYGRVLTRDATGAEGTIRQVVKELMTEHFPGHEDPNPAPTADLEDTSGTQKILFTITDAHVPGAAGGDNVAQRGITSRTPVLIKILEGQDIFDLDGNTKLYDSAAERLDVYSPCQRGSHTDGKRWREWYIDPDGTGKTPTISVLSKVSDSNIKPLPTPPAAGCTPEQLTKAKQEGYDLALSVFPPRPA